MTQKDLFPNCDILTAGIPLPTLLRRGEAKKALKMTATSGRTSLELLHKKTDLVRFRKRSWSHCLGSRPGAC